MGILKDQMLLVKLFLPMAVAFAISLCFTPIAIKIAHHVKAIDIPNDERRIHKKPTPLLGGLAIFLSVMVSLVIFSEIETTKVVGIIVGSSIIVFMGFIDDINPVPAKVKFLVQIICAFILVFSNIRITGLSSILKMSETIVLDDFIGVLLSVFWIVGITNTLNLIDGVDGLSSGIASISSLTIAYIAFINHRYDMAIITLIVAGACFGFLPFNFNPAQIFMGDTGSLFLGYILAAISIEGTLKSATAITFFAPVLALGIPILDTTMAIIRRVLRGQSPFKPDKEHLHHKILNMGAGQRKTVLILYFINILFGISVVFMMHQKYMEMATALLMCMGLVVYINHKNRKNAQ